MAEAGAQTAEVLLALQALDTEIMGLKRDIEALPQKHKLAEIHERLETARAAEAEKEKELEELKGRQLKLDGELDLLSQKIKKEEQKLFSGTVMNPKELSAIQAEILSLRKKRDEMETEDLEEMESIDGLRGDMVGFGEDKQTADGEERAASDAFESELAEMEGTLAAEEIKREALKKRLDPEMAEEYEKLIASRSAVAVVMIEQGRSCGGCHVEFSNTQVDTFQHEEGPFRCPYCRRLLIK